MVSPTESSNATPEERSKQLVLAEYQLLTSQASHFAWECRLDDRGDYYVIYVRIEKPGARTFVLRLECDDYPKQAPYATFVDPQCWDTKDQDKTAPEFYPQGAQYLHDKGKGYRVMCIRGHRDYYANGWHSGWTDPPNIEDRIFQLVVHIRNAIMDLWS